MLGEKKKTETHRPFLGMFGTILGHVWCGSRNTEHNTRYCRRDGSPGPLETQATCSMKALQSWSSATILWPCSQCPSKPTQTWSANEPSPSTSLELPLTLSSKVLRGQWSLLGSGSPSLHDDTSLAQMKFKDLYLRRVEILFLSCFQNWEGCQTVVPWFFSIHVSPAGGRVKSTLVVGANYK